MILTTTSSIEGKPVREYLGPVGAEVIWGANFWKDAGAQVADFFGGRVRDYEQVYADSRITVLHELRKAARELGASAVVSIRFDYQTMGEKNQILMVAATGTAVTLSLSADELALQQKVQLENDEAYFIDINSQRKGPFSMAQLRALLLRGRVDLDTVTYSEEGAAGQTVRQLCSNGEEPL